MMHLTMKVLIVEDEQLAVEKLGRAIAVVDATIEVVGHTDGIESTVQWLRTNPAPDLIFLDIELSDGQCFKIFEQVVVNSVVIFTTSYEDYAVQAFKVNSIDYLLKPIKQEDVRRSLEKYKLLKNQFGQIQTLAPNIERLIKDIQQQITPEYRHRFLVKQGQRMILVEVDEIAYFYSESSVSFFKTKANARFSLEYTLDQLESLLDPKVFFRANRSFILPARAVEAIYPYFNGRLKVELKPASEGEVIISREKASEFKNWLGR